MERLLGGLEGVPPYFDDFIITAMDQKELMQKLRAVLAIFKQNGLRLNKEKCVFHAKTLDFLGHQVNAEGIQPLEEKTAAMRNSPHPTNKKELQAFLGMLGFYQPFLKSFATARRESVLNVVMRCLKYGWPAAEKKVPAELLAYYRKKDENLAKS